MSEISQVPTPEEIRKESDPGRRAVMEAIVRIIEERPIVVARGKRTFTHLALEAGVSRHVLYQKYPDLRDWFEYLRDHASKPSAVEEQLASDLEDLRAKLQMSEELASKHFEAMHQWKGLAELLIRAVNVLEAEKRDAELRAERLQVRLDRFTDTRDSSASAVVIPMPSVLADDGESRN